MESEKFCLKWNDFERNISHALKGLCDDKDFFDVTLACDDEKIQAHKVILSACSPFFRKILKKNPHQHPLLYLKGVKHADLQSVLNFMYHGEVNIAQGELNSFLAVAEDLQVKGLTQNNSTQYESNNTNTKTPVPCPSRSDKRNNKSQSNDSSPHSSNKKHLVEYNDVQEVIPIKSEPRDIPIPIPVPMPPAQPCPALPGHNPTTILNQADAQDMEYPEDTYTGYDQYDEQGYQGEGRSQDMSSEIHGTEGQQFQDPSDLLQFVRKDSQDQKFHCTLCDKFSHKWSSCTRNHVESLHFPSTFCYPCDECEMIFNTKTKFNKHRSNMHTAKNK